MKTNIHEDEHPWATKGDIEHILNAVKATWAEVATLRCSARLHNASASSSASSNTPVVTPVQPIEVNPVHKPPNPRASGHWSAKDIVLQVQFHL